MIDRHASEFRNRFASIALDFATKLENINYE